MIKNIIFDIGGVVVTRSKFNKILKLFSKLVFGTKNPDFFKEEYINPKIKKEWQQWRLGKITANQFFKRQRKKYHLKLSTNKLAYILYRSQKPNKKIVSMIKKLKKRYRIYALTNHTKEWFAYQKDKYNYNAIFSGTVTSFEAGSAKPNIIIYKKLLETYKLIPEECLLIDDQEENLIPAQKLGIKTIHYKNIFLLKKQLKHHGILRDNRK